MQQLTKMAIEIERKYRIDMHLLAELARKLEEFGAEFAYEDFEENYLHRGGVLDERNAVLRVRKTERSTRLTYKERLAMPSEFKRMVEFETEVSDAEATAFIIERLGFKLVAVYEKRRRAWRLSGAEVVLDELPFGFYMEIEGSQETIAKVETMLGIEDIEVEPVGYPGLTMRFGEKIGDVIEARFLKP